MYTPLPENERQELNKERRAAKARHFVRLTHSSGLLQAALELSSLPVLSGQVREAWSVPLPPPTKDKMDEEWMLESCAQVNLDVGWADSEASCLDLEDQNALSEYGDIDQGYESGDSGQTISEHQSEIAAYQKDTIDDLTDTFEYSWHGETVASIADTTTIEESQLPEICTTYSKVKPTLTFITPLAQTGYKHKLHTTDLTRTFIIASRGEYCQESVQMVQIGPLLHSSLISEKSQAQTYDFKVQQDWNPGLIATVQQYIAKAMGFDRSASQNQQQSMQSIISTRPSPELGQVNQIITSALAKEHTCGRFADVQLGLVSSHTFLRPLLDGINSVTSNKRLSQNLTYLAYWNADLHRSLNQWLGHKDTLLSETQLRSITLGCSTGSICAPHKEISHTSKDTTHLRILHITLPKHALQTFFREMPLEWIVIEVCQEARSYILAFPKLCITVERVLNNTTKLTLGHQGISPCAYGFGIHPDELQHFMLACTYGMAEVGLVMNEGGNLVTECASSVYTETA